MPETDILPTSGLETTSLPSVKQLATSDQDSEPRLLNKKANAALARFKQTAGIQDLDEAIVLHHQSLELCPPGHISRNSCLNSLAGALIVRYKKTGSMEDLEWAIRSHREALELRPPGHRHRGSSLSRLASALNARHTQTGQIEDLDEAIKMNREALELHTLGDISQSASFNNLAKDLLARFNQTGKIEDLDEAIIVNRQALGLRPLGYPSRATSLNNLANAILARHEQAGVMQDLNDAIDLNRQGLELRPVGHPKRSSSLYGLANAILTRFEKMGEMEDLEEAIDLNHQALELCPLGHQNHSSILISLANTLFARSQRMGTIVDLDGAIDINGRALKLLPPGSPDRSLCLNNMANYMFTRFKQNGTMQDLDDAIEMNRQALELCPLGHPGRNSSLNNLASAVLERFQRMGSVQDLDEAIDLNRNALKLFPLGHIGHGKSINNLSNALFVCFQYQGSLQDLEEAIDLNRQVLELRAPGHPDRSLCLNNLAIGFHARFRKKGNIQDLEEAIHFHREALELRPLGHPDHVVSLISLSSALVLHSGNTLHEVAHHLLEAVKSVPKSSPWSARSQHELAEVYLKQYALEEPDVPSLDAIFQLFEDSSSNPSAKLTYRFYVALRWVTRAREYSHESLLRAYSAALALLHPISAMTTTLDTPHGSFISETLDRHKSLACDAASSAIEVGKPEIAIELLEQGRAITWSRMRGYRDPLTALIGVDPELAQEFKLVGFQLERYATVAARADTNSPIFHEADDRNYRRLLEKWNEVVRKIRAVDGFKDFLQAVPFDTLRKAAAEGPVILINIGTYRSDAIILRDATSPILVALPRASPKALADLASLFAVPGAETRPNFSRELTPILRALWSLVVQPVVEKLTELAVKKKSRIWWCPTAQLCVLPIHAAGPYTANQLNLPDRYVSSYTPTLMALISARSNLENIPAIPNLLVVAQPDESLPTVEEEVLRIKKFTKFTPMIGSEASPASVVSNLQHHSWVHFACHGHRNTQPFYSSFQLHGSARLRLLDIMQAQLPNAELAFLSACHGAAVDRNSPDESINLATALQFCGFRSVVGTFWAMADQDGPTVAEAFYRHMFREPGRVDFRDAANALNLATRDLRRQKVPLGRWVNFIHIGA